MVESREHLEQPDGQPKKLITGEAQKMRQEFVRRGNLGISRKLDRQRSSKRCRPRSDAGRVPGGSLRTRTLAGGVFYT